MKNDTALSMTSKMLVLHKLKTDDYLWIWETVKLLKEKPFNELDLENLIEEFEDMGNEKRNVAKSLLEQVIIYLLLIIRFMLFWFQLLFFSD